MKNERNLERKFLEILKILPNRIFIQKFQATPIQPKYVHRIEKKKQ